MYSSVTISPEYMRKTNSLEILAAARESGLNERVSVHVRGGRLTFEGDQVPADLLFHPELFLVKERLTGKPPILNASYSFVRRSTKGTT